MANLPIVRALTYKLPMVVLAVLALAAAGVVGVAAVRDGTPAEAQQALSAQSYFVAAEPPARTYDSRNDPDGPIIAGESYQIDLSDLPANATAVVVNITVVNTITGTDGWLKVYAQGGPFPNVSTINFWESDQVIANMVTIPTGAPNNAIVVNAGGEGATNFIVDIYGWYVPA